MPKKLTSWPEAPDPPERDFRHVADGAIYLLEAGKDYPAETDERTLAKNLERFADKHGYHVTRRAKIRYEQDGTKLVEGVAVQLAPREQSRELVERTLQALVGPYARRLECALGVEVETTETEDGPRVLAAGVHLRGSAGGVSEPRVPTIPWSGESDAPQERSGELSQARGV